MLADTDLTRPPALGQPLVADPHADAHADHVSTDRLADAVGPVGNAWTKDHGETTVADIQSHLLEGYAEEGRRLELEADVHGEMVLLERAKGKERFVPGLDNEDLNALLRTFDKHVQTVHQCPPPYDKHIPLGLDLHPHPDESFELHKLSSAFERFYASVVVGVLRALNEVQRIRHWEDGGARSAVALAIYAYAWWCNLIITALLAFISVLILVPSSRMFFFSPSLNNKAKPDDIYHGDTVNIANDKLRDEWSVAGTENKATNWAANVQSLLLSLTSPKSGSNETETLTKGIQQNVDRHLKEDMEKRGDAGAMREGDEEMSKQDKAVKIYAQPGMRVISGLADKWERVANAINPSPSWEVQSRRWSVFTSLVLPLILVSTFVPEWVFSRAFGIVFGLLLFGDPLIKHLIDELDRAMPDWKERLILEHNLFETVPTNSQLVLRLLRNAEYHNHPLPPPPAANDDTGADDGDDDGDEDDADDDDETSQPEGKSKKAMTKMSKRARTAKDGVRAKARKAWDRLGHAKENSFAVITGHRPINLEGKAERTMDKLHIDKESAVADKILDRLPGKPDYSPEDPAAFYVRHVHHGPGHLIIHPGTPGTSTGARIEFTTIRRVSASQNAALHHDAEPVKGHLVVEANDIVGLEKVGLSLPKRAALGWALDAEGAGGTGLVVRVVRRIAAEAVTSTVGSGALGDEAGQGVGDEVSATVAQGKEEEIRLVDIVRRNELFDRLLAIGDQRWEML